MFRRSAVPCIFLEQSRSESEIKVKAGPDPKGVEPPDPSFSIFTVFLFLMDFSHVQRNYFGF
jgi:hypothetical protein